MTPRLLDALTTRPLLADGAMGTQLMLAGLEQGGCGEKWNLTERDRVLGIQRRYVEAGSDCLLTNTFGGSRIALARHGYGDEAVEINRAAVAIAREAFGGREGFVIGDIGPFGGLMEPYGDVREERRSRGLPRAGDARSSRPAPTRSSSRRRRRSRNCCIGIAAARDAGAAVRHRLDGVRRDARRLDLPDDDGRGPRARRAGRWWTTASTSSALNCGTGMDMERALEAARRYRRVTDAAADDPAQRRAAEARRHEGRLRRVAGTDGGRRRPACSTRVSPSSAPAAAARPTTSARSGARWTNGAPRTRRPAKARDDPHPL